MALGEYRGPSSAKAFVRYLLARFRREARDLSYRSYVTDSLRLIPQMGYLTRRWYEPTTPTDNRSADEIIEYVSSRLEEA